LERHLPFIDNAITFQFFTEIPGIFIWEERSKIEGLHFDVINFVELPITFARALPEFNSVLMMIIEELSEVVKNESCLLLEHVQERVEDLFCHMDGIYDNNDFRYVLEMGCLINAVSNSEEFSFSASNVDHMVKSFDDQPIVNMNMRYRQCNIVFDTGICDYECIGWRVGRFNC